MASQIEKAYMINASPEEVWAALTVPVEIEGWGAGPVQMIPEDDTDFSLWDGDIYGRNVEVKAPSYLKQEWYGGPWQRPSIVEFTLTAVGGQTQIKMTQDGVPTEEIDDIDNSWDEFYLGAIKEYLEL